MCLRNKEKISKTVTSLLSIEEIILAHLRTPTHTNNVPHENGNFDLSSECY
jgi:hypothetical protein